MRRQQVCLGEREPGALRKVGALGAMSGAGAGTGVDGTVTPKGMRCLGAGAQVDHVLQTPHPDTTQQGTRELGALP